VFFDTAYGLDVMQPMAIRSVGGMAVQLITLFVAPYLNCLVERMAIPISATRRDPNEPSRGGLTPRQPGSAARQ
jgi:hypothetical protein